MLSTRSSDLQHKTFLIKQDDKFFTRLLSRELSMSRSNTKIGSFRGLPSSVPFIWESQPGTPKHRFHSADEYTEPLPPLTPPPSFYSTMDKSSKFRKIKRQSSLNALFHKLSFIKKSSSSSSSTKQPPASPTISSHSTTSSSSTCSSCPGSSSRTRRTRFGSWGGYSSSSSGKLDEEDGNFINGSPTSTLCFMIRKKNNKNNDLQKKGLIHSHEIMF